VQNERRPLTSWQLLVDVHGTDEIDTPPGRNLHDYTAARQMKLFLDGVIAHMRVNSGNVCVAGRLHFDGHSQFIQCV